MTVRTYSSPESFKQALEQRLRTATKTGIEFARRRQLLVFDRFLARVVAVFGDSAMLKGGLVLELRLDRARTTKDVDLRLTGSPDHVLKRLQAAARVDLGDFMTFEVGPDAENVLGFAGIAPPTLRLYPLETHIAEKLHAYTMPRARPNSRVKDLPDLALLATARRVAAKRLRAALEQTFRFRKTHELPPALPEPAKSWIAPYATMARGDQLIWPTLAEVTAAARAFLDPVLAGDLDAAWDPAAWAWVPSPS